MNKVYKVIFNKSLGVFVVVSEKAKSILKSSSNGVVPTLNDQTAQSYPTSQKFKMGLLASCILFSAHSAYADLQIDGSTSFPNNITNSTDYIVVGEANHNKDSKATNIFGKNNTSIKGQNIVLNGTGNYVASFLETPASYITLVGNNQTANNSNHISSLGASNNFYGDYIGILGEVNKIGGNWASATSKAEYVYGLGFNNQIGTNSASKNISFIATDSTLDGNNIYAIGSGLVATGNNNVLIGGKNKTIGNSNTAVGQGATIEGSSSTAIGANATALSSKSTAVGYIARANAESSVAIGNQATVSAANTNSVALGANSNANGLSLQQDAYLTKSKATAEINIANGSAQRRLTGLADGALDTDATTVRQLKVVDTKIDTTKTELNNKIDTTKQELSTQINDTNIRLDTTKTELSSQIVTTKNELTSTGLNFSTNTGEVIHRRLGDRLDIVGGADPEQESSNENVITRATDGGISVELLKDVKFDSVRTNNTEMNSSGFYINEGPSLTVSGVDAGNMRITNVADGEDTFDAVNKGQLDAAFDSSVRYDPETSNSSITLIGEAGTTIKNVKDGVDLTDAVNVQQLQKVDNRLDIVETDLNDKIISTNNHIDSTKSELTNQIAVTRNELATAGLNFAANTGAEVHRNLGETLNILGGAENTEDASSGQNVVTRSTEDGIKVELLNNVNFETVTTGNAVLNKNGLFITEGPSLSVNGIDAGGQKIINVGDGEDPFDAINKGQLDAAFDSAVRYDEGSYSSSITLMGEMGTTIKNVQDGVDEKDAVNVRQLGKVDSKVDSVREDLSNEIIDTNDRLDTTTEQLTGQIKDTKTELSASINETNTRLDTTKSELSNQIVTTKTDLTNAGLNFGANSGATVHRNLGETLNIVGGADANKASSNQNVVTRATEGGISVELLKDVNFDSVTTGNTSITNNGLTIKDGPSISTTGISAGGKKIANVANGEATNDAVNKGQLDGVTSTLTTSINDTNTRLDNTKTELSTSIKDTNTRIDTTTEQLTGQIKDTKTELSTSINDTNNRLDTTKSELSNQIVTTKTDLTNTGLNFAANTGMDVHRNLGQKLSILGGAQNTEDSSSGDNVVTRTTEGGIKIELLNNVNFESVTTGNAVLNKNGLFLTEGPSISTNGIDAGGQKVVNVADGEDPFDAVNKGQLDSVILQHNELADHAVRYDQDSGNSSITLIGEAGTTIKNVKDGVDLTDAVNVQQLKQVDNRLDLVEYDLNDKIIATNDHIDTTKAELTNQIAVTKNELATAGMNFTANTGEELHRNLGETLGIVGGADADKASSGQNVITRATESGISVELLKDVNFDSVTTGNTTLNTNGLTIKDGASITNTGVNAGGKKVTNVANGEAATDAVNKGQLDGVSDTLTTSINDTNTRLDNTKTELSTSIKDTNTRLDTATEQLTGQISDTNTRLDTTKTELANQISTTKTDLTNAGLNFAANSGTAVHRNLGETISIVGGADADKASSGENIITRATEKGIAVELLKNVNFDSVTSGNTTLNNNGLTINNGPSITTTGISAGGKKVTNVANGEAATDAVNKGQLDDVVAQQGNLNNSAVKYDGSDKSKISLMGETGTTITNLKDGVADTDAVNVRQLTKVDNKIDGVRDVLTADIKDTSNRLDTTKTELSTSLKDTNTRLDTATEQLTGQISDTNTRLDTTKTELSTSIKDTNTRLDTATEQLTGQISDTNTRLDTTKTELTNQISTTKTDLTNAGLNFSANSGKTVHRNLGETISIVGGADADKPSSGTNVVTRATDTGISVELLKDVNFDSVTTGNTTLNTNGLTIKDGPSITQTGISAGGKKVTNVANGEAATDAVNKGQLDDVIAQQGSLDNSAVKYDGSDKSKISLMGETGTTITNLKDGVADTDAVNVRQLNKVDNKIDGVRDVLTSDIKDTNTRIDTATEQLTGQITDTNTRLDTTKTELTNQISTTKTDLTNAGLNFAANSGKTVHRNLGETISIVGGADAAKASSGENVITRATENGIAVELLKDVNFDSVTTGNTTLNTNGLTINNGPSITTTGINAGGKRVINIAKGEIAEGSTDAINGDQIHNVTTSIKNVVGGKTTVNDDGTITAQNIGGTGKNTIDDAISSVNAKVDGGITEIQNTGLNFGANTGDTVHRKLGQKLNIVGGADADADETSAENVVTRTTKDGIQIELLKDVKFDSATVGGNILNQQGLFIQNGPSMTVTGIDAGGKRVINIADGVNKNDAVNKGQLDKLKDEVAQEIGKIPSLDNVVKYDQDAKDSVTLGGENGTTIKNVADGAIKEGSKDAVNGGQLWNVQQQVDKNTNDISNIQNNIENINNGKAGVVQQETANSNITVGKDTGGKVVDMGGKEGDRTVQGVKAGEISASSNQAVNGSQIHNINNSIKNVIGGETTLNGDGTLSASNIGGTGKNTVDGAINSINQNQLELNHKVDSLGDRLEQAFYDTNNRMDGMKKDLSAGIAAAMAVGNLPQPTEAGKSMVSAGVSGYGGERAVSIGVSAISDNNKYVWKFGGTADTRSNVSGAISVGYQW